MPDQLTVLGFDFGTHWIGAAVGQSHTCTASPLDAIRVLNNKPQWESIAMLIGTWQPQRLIVGLPSSMNGEDTDVTEQARKFSRQLEGRFHIKTELIDERLTTREAWQIVQDKAEKFQSKSDIDSIAATLITETWLNQQYQANNGLQD